MEQYMKDFHGDTLEQEAYVFYSRNTGKYGKLSQTAIDKFLKKYAGQCHTACLDVPINLHAHNFRHAKASHWLEDGMNIVQISFLLGHENLQTTMIYLDINTDQVSEALATIENEKDKMVTPKWKVNDGSLLNFCGLTL
jgi:site-specific recombinase XerD